MVEKDIKQNELSLDNSTSRVALVADLLTSQANHIASLKWAVGILESKITLRNSLAEVQAEALKDPFKEVAQVLARVRDFIVESQDQNLKGLLSDIEEGLLQVKKAVDAIGEWLSSSTDPTILYPREALRRVPLRQVIDRALNDLGASFDRARLELVVPPANTLITTAPARLAAIITAILDNANKYSSEGKIRCICAITHEHDLSIIVQDNGPGLRGVEPEELFKPRPRENYNDKEWQPLLGLGLFLTKMMAESLGGSVKITEREPHGLEVKVTLPQRRRRDIVVEPS